MKSYLSGGLALLLAIQIAFSPLARADFPENGQVSQAELVARMQTWVRVVQTDPAHPNVLWVLKQMNLFAADPVASKQLTGKLGNAFRELRKDMLQASAFHQRLGECASREKHANAAVNDLEFRYVLRLIDNPADCVACNIKSSERQTFVDKLARPFGPGRDQLSVPEAMDAANFDFGFGDPAHAGKDAEYLDAVYLMSDSVLETQKNVLRNYIYFKEHFEIEAEKPRTGLVPKPKDGVGYVHSLFFGCHNVETGEYQPPLIGCGAENFSDSEYELKAFADREIADVRAKFGRMKNADQVYADLEPIFAMMAEEEREAVTIQANFETERRERERRTYEFEQANGIKRDGIMAGVPKIRPFYKNTYQKTRELIVANIGHESAFLFQTEALTLEKAALPKNRSPEARKEMIRAALREVVAGTKAYSDYIKRKGGVYNGFGQPKALQYVNQTTNMLIRTSPNAVVRTLYEKQKLVRASCAALKQMAESYRQTTFDRILLWGGILVAGISIALITGGLAVPGFAALTANLGLFGYTTVAGLTLTTANLGNNIWRSDHSNFNEQISVLRGADPAVDRYQNPKLKLDLADAVAQHKKLNTRILWNLIDYATYAAMPLLVKAWDKFSLKYLTKVDPNDMFVVKQTGDARYVSLKDADGKINFGRIAGSTEDGSLTKIRLLHENQDVIVTAAERGLWKVDPVAKLKFDQHSPTALVDVKDVSEIGLGIKLKFVRLQSNVALPTAIEISPNIRRVGQDAAKRREQRVNQPTRKLKGRPSPSPEPSARK